MTAPISRSDKWGTLGNHEKRIRVLEGLTPSSGFTGFCCGNPPPLGGFGGGTSRFLMGCAIFDDWDTIDGGRYVQQTICGSIAPGGLLAPGTELWVRGIAFGFDPTLTAGSAWQLGATSAAGTTVTAFSPLVPVASPDNGFIGWTNLGLTSEDAGVSIQGIMVIDLGGIFFPFNQVGFYTVQWAWIPAGTPYDSSLEDSIVNPGQDYGDMLFWNGANWQIVPAGVPGQVLTVGGDQKPGWV